MNRKAEQTVIPKTIHYCWFGRNPLDERSIRCIESWKRFFPGYQIIQWNEDNFDVRQNEFMEKAYEDKKWAFVSDVARLKIIYDYGGIYFDTDVEVVAPYDDILDVDAEGFLGYEKTGYVATGLGFGASAGHPLIGRMLEVYSDLDYDAYKDRLAEVACPLTGTKVLMEHGFIREDRKQSVCGLNVYPSEFFSPIDYYSGKTIYTKNTHSIHWYNDSWNSADARKKREAERRIYRVFGKKLGGMLLGVTTCIHQEGIADYIKTRTAKVLKGKK